MPTEVEVEQIKYDFAHRLETYKSLIAVSMEFAKYLALLNGGAAAGLIAGIANIEKKVSAFAIKGAMICFVIGLLLNGVGLMFSYFTQNVLYGESVRRPSVGNHKHRLWVAAFAYTLSLVLFCIGALIGVFGLKD